MSHYERTELNITEFDAEDVITTSGVPSEPTRTITMNSPNYQSDSSDSEFGWNWTLWQ